MITRERLMQVLRYDPDTGFFIRLRSGIRAGAFRQTTPKHRYRIITIDGRTYKEHRLAWLYMTGRWPDGDLDHADTDGTNNRWLNLREATRSQNVANCRTPSNNKLGVKGVRKQARGGYLARIRVAGKAICLGTYPSIEEAAAAYRAAAIKHFGDFARTK
jgi:hypothetical protein